MAIQEQYTDNSFDFEYTQKSLTEYFRNRGFTLQEVEDLTQESVSHIVEHLPNFVDIGIPLSHWINRIAKHVGIDYRRKLKRQTNLSLQGNKDIVYIATSNPLVQIEHSLDVRSQMAGLSAQERELLSLRYGDDLSLREIAALVGKSENTVKQQMKRARDRFKAAYLSDQVEGVK